MSYAVRSLSGGWPFVKPITFAHISDTHVDSNRDATLRGGQPLANLKRAVQEILALPKPVDFVLHTGDVCGGVSSSVGVVDGYRNVTKSIAMFTVPCYFTLGNHDHPQIAFHHLPFPAHERLIDTDPWSYTFRCNDIFAIVLNARIDDRGRGELSQEHLIGLQNVLRSTPDPTIIAIHFTPLMAGQYWNDTHMLLSNGEQLHNILKRHAQRIRGVFFGHLHRPFQRLYDGILYVCGPSTAYGIDFWCGETRPRILHQRSVGWNWVRISERGTEIRFMAW